VTRRRFLTLGAASAGLMSLGAYGSGSVRESEPWDRGDLAHLLPLVNHRRMLIKSSFTKPLDFVPRLNIDGQEIAGLQSDSDGRFWQFDLDDLEPAREYILQLTNQRGKPLCDPWPLTTYPHPDSQVEHVRLLSFTCAGGNGDMVLPNGIPIFLPVETRQRLLRRALSFQPDIAIANGDHIYWDQKTTSLMKNAKLREYVLNFFASFGEFRRDLPVLGSENEAILKRVADPQIARLYGVEFRSVPMYFLADDHDLMDNDEATQDYITFPPDAFMSRAARATQYLYYPEFLPDENRPLGLAGSAMNDRAEGLSENFGTLRYGRLLEALLYDCRRFMTLKDHLATFIPVEAEEWLRKRTQARDTAQLLHVPSTPVGWTAGKWGEWYPDVLDDGGQLTIDEPKYMWQKGWWLQHQRILSMLHHQKHRAAISLSGDLHATGWGTIQQSGELDLRSNPVYSILSGTPGTAGPGWPSFIRQTPPMNPLQLQVENGLAPLEKNGFTLLDITPQKIKVRQFAWLPDQPLDAIDSLQPIEVFEIPRPIL
jgi:phosphodiesterase/alkaline phosphatase D-like protein